MVLSSISSTDQRWFAERSRLIRLCARITGHADVAEDLAQESLLEAWRHLHSLRDPERFSSWLAGIAHNVCLRWMRAEQRHVAHRASQPLDEVEEEGGDDLGCDLERQDLTDSLNRTLAMLPQDVQDLLIAHCVEGRSLRDLAIQQNSNEAALAKRIQRGKVAFKRLVANAPELWDQFSPAQPMPQMWETTAIWCPLCGGHIWKARHAAGLVQYACPHCHDESLPVVTTHYTWGAKGYKRVLFKMMSWVEETYRPYLSAPARPCPKCGRVVPLEREGLTLHLHCPWCHTVNENTVPMLALGTTEGRKFWQGHPKIQMQPTRDVEIGGRSARLITYGDTMSRTAFEVAFAADTFEILAAHTMQ